MDTWYIICILAGLWEDWNIQIIQFNESVRYSVSNNTSIQITMRDFWSLILSTILIYRIFHIVATIFTKNISMKLKRLRLSPLFKLSNYFILKFGHRIFTKQTQLLLISNNKACKSINNATVLSYYNKDTRNSTLYAKTTPSKIFSIQGTFSLQSNFLTCSRIQWQFLRGNSVKIHGGNDSAM